jgi:ribosomal protein L11 methyltransferase
VPYVLHLRAASDGTLDSLVELGALDVEHSGDGGLTALMPDDVMPGRAATVLGTEDIVVAAAAGRDDGSVWTLRPRPIHVGRIHIVPAPSPASAPVPERAVRLIDAAVFGTGLHPTTALCLELLSDIAGTDAPASMLDVGTGSGVLALAALTLGMSRAVAVDVDDEAIRVAAENARLTGVSERLELVHGGPDQVTGAFPLVVANVLAAPLVEMAPVLVRRVAHQGRLVLSGIHRSLDADVVRAYRRLGMHHVSTTTRGEWTALLLLASW